MGVEAGLLQRLVDLLGHLWAPRRIVLQLVGLGRESAVVVVELMFVAIANSRPPLAPMRRHQDDGPRGIRRPQAENLGHLLGHRLDQIGVARVAHDGHGTAAMADRDDGRWHRVVLAGLIERADGQVGPKEEARQECG